jgi:hypothetical protein
MLVEDLGRILAGVGLGEIKEPLLERPPRALRFLDRR